MWPARAVIMCSQCVMLDRHLLFHWGAPQFAVYFPCLLFCAPNLHPLLTGPIQDWDDAHASRLYPEIISRERKLDSFLTHYLILFASCCPHSCSGLLDNWMELIEKGTKAKWLEVNGKTYIWTFRIKDVLNELTTKPLCVHACLCMCVPVLLGFFLREVPPLVMSD